MVLTNSNFKNGQNENYFPKLQKLVMNSMEKKKKKRNANDRKFEFGTTLENVSMLSCIWV